MWSGRGRIVLGGFTVMRHEERVVLEVLQQRRLLGRRICPKNSISDAWDTAARIATHQQFAGYFVPFSVILEHVKSCCQISSWDYHQSNHGQSCDGRKKNLFLALPS